MCSFISRIKVYAYAYNHSPKRKMVPAAYFQMLQAVVIQDTVIDPFTCSAFTVYYFILIRISGDTWMETQVSMIFYVGSPPVTAGGAFRFIWAEADTPASEGTTVFVCIFDRVISPWAHFMPCPAKRVAFLVESNVIRGIFRRFCPTVDINEGIDIPVFQQLISRDVVMCGVKAYVFRRNAKGITPEIIYGIEEVFTVMAACASEFHQQGEFNFQCIVPAAQHVKRMPKVPCFVITVPSPFSIRVRIMASAVFPVWAAFATGGKMPAVRRSMGNNSSTITG